MKSFSARRAQRHPFAHLWPSVAFPLRRPFPVLCCFVVGTLLVGTRFVTVPALAAESLAAPAGAGVLPGAAELSRPADSASPPSMATVVTPVRERRPYSIAVWQYSRPRGGRDRDTLIVYEKGAGLIYEKSSGLADFAAAVSNAVSDELADAHRFTVIGRAALEEAANEDMPTGAAAALDAGRRLGVDFVVYGDIENVSADLTRTETETKDGDKKKKDVRWTAKTTASVHHVVLDTRSGRVWKEKRDTLSREESLYTRPSSGAWKPMLAKMAGQTADRLVRELVPELKGQVLARQQDGTLIINLGRLDGVGTDTDFVFERETVLRDAGGQPVLDQNGRLLSRLAPVQAAPSGKHNPMLVVGRVEAVEPEFCIVRLGYRGSGGFLGLEKKFKANDDMARAIVVGDRASLVVREAK